MLQFLARRLVFALLLVFLVASSALVLVELAPGDFVTTAHRFGASADTLARARQASGLDRPLVVRYADWVTRAVGLDFGDSLLYARPVRGLVAERAVNTTVLAVSAFALALVIGLPLGVVSARGAAAGAAVRGLSIIFLSVPPLVLSLGLVLVAARTGVVPAGGMHRAGLGDAGAAARAVDLLWHLAVPALSLALPLGAMFERLQARALTDAVANPVLTAARARGVPPRRLLWRHAWRLGLKPVATTASLAFGALMSGSFAVEMATAWPGLGRLMYDALRARDAALVAGCATAGAAVLALASLAGDLTVAWSDPRARLGESQERPA